MTTVTDEPLSHAIMRKVQRELEQGRDYPAILEAIEAALAASSPARVPGWRPIETAPKDGTPVLVWSNGHVTVAAHAQHKFRGHPWRELYHMGTSLHRAPTHWQPLPPPPATTEPDAYTEETGR